MTRSAARSLADVVVTEHVLQPQDEATRRRVSEFLHGVEPSAGRFQPEPEPEPEPEDPPAPPVADPGTSGAGAGWWTRLRGRVGGLIRRVHDSVDVRMFCFAALTTLAAMTVLLILGWGWRQAAIAALVAVGLWAVAFVWFARQRRWRPVPSDLSRPAYAPRAPRRAEVLDPPGAPSDPPVEPLLVPRWTPGILNAALAVDRSDGVLDVDRLVEALGRLDLPSRLPRRTRWSVDSGAQVLVDLSEDMLPFRQDVLGLLRRVRDVVGRDRVTVLRFAGRPLTAIGPGRQDTWGGYVAPHTRAAVLVITNFGLASTRLGGDDEEREREWLALARTLAGLRCPLVALVPNATARVPTRLRGAMALVEWDRGTSAASVLRAVGR